MAPSGLKIIQEFLCGFLYLSMVEVVERDGHVLTKGECQKYTILPLENFIWKLSDQATAFFSLFSCSEFWNHAFNVLHADGKTLQGEICWGILAPF